MLTMGAFDQNCYSLFLASESSQVRYVILLAGSMQSLVTIYRFLLHIQSFACSEVGDGLLYSCNTPANDFIIVSCYDLVCSFVPLAHTFHIFASSYHNLIHQGSSFLYSFSTFIVFTIYAFFKISHSMVDCQLLVAKCTKPPNNAGPSHV